MLICQRCRIAAGIASRGVPVYRLCRASPDAEPVTFDQTAKPCCGGKHEPKPAPSMASRLWHLATDVAAFASEPGFVTAEEYQDRLSACESCDRRQEGQCLECGCFVSLRAKGKAWDCPLNKWPKTKE